MLVMVVSVQLKFKCDVMAFLTNTPQGWRKENWVGQAIATNAKDATWDWKIMVQCVKGTL